MSGDSETSTTPSQNDSSLSDDESSRIASPHDKTSKPRTSQSRKKPTKTYTPSQNESSLSDDRCSTIASPYDRTSKPRTSQPREKPTKENSKNKPKLLAKKSIKQENKPKTRIVRIHVLDPDATDSSSEEEQEQEQVVSSKRRVRVHKIQIPYITSHLHESQRRRELLSIKREGRGKKAKEDEKKNSGLSSCSSCTSFEGFDGGDNKELECFEIPGLCDVPGPMPDLDSLIKDASNLLFNFFEGLPDE